MIRLLTILIAALMLASCSSDKDESIIPEPELNAPELISLSFSCNENPMQLTTDEKVKLLVIV